MMAETSEDRLSPFSSSLFSLYSLFEFTSEWKICDRAGKRLRRCKRRSLFGVARAAPRLAGWQHHLARLSIKNPVYIPYMKEGTSWLHSFFSIHIVEDGKKKVKQQASFGLLKLGLNHSQNLLIRRQTFRLRPMFLFLDLELIWPDFELVFFPALHGCVPNRGFFHAAV